FPDRRMHSHERMYRPCNRLEASMGFRWLSVDLILIRSAYLKLKLFCSSEKVSVRKRRAQTGTDKVVRLTYPLQLQAQGLLQKRCKVDRCVKKRIAGFPIPDVDKLEGTESHEVTDRKVVHRTRVQLAVSEVDHVRKNTWSESAFSAYIPIITNSNRITRNGGRITSRLPH